MNSSTLSYAGSTTVLRENHTPEGVYPNILAQACPNLDSNHDYNSPQRLKSGVLFLIGGRKYSVEARLSEQLAATDMLMVQYDSYCFLYSLQSTATHSHHDHVVFSMLFGCDTYVLDMFLFI